MIMAGRIKILSLVSYKFLPPDMGGQKGIAFFNRYLARETDLCCVTVMDNKEISGEGYVIRNILSDHKFRYINPRYFFTLRRIIREEQVSHLLIEHPYYGWLAILLKQFCNVKLVVHSHNIEALRFKSVGKWWYGILWNYERFTHRRADHNFFIHDDDRNYAISKFGLDPAKCTTITYGFEYPTIPAAAEKEAARKFIAGKHKIDPAEKILLFNGTLGYKPNLEALDIILQKINPQLLAAAAFPYKIIICGSRLPAGYEGLVPYQDKNIIYAGFVPDINPYFKGSDIFINPVIEGGGIKTKLVEALGYDLSVVSTRSGATGIPSSITGDKMKLVEDGDWAAFTGDATPLSAHGVTTRPTTLLLIPPDVFRAWLDAPAFRNLVLGLFAEPGAAVLAAVAMMREHRQWFAPQASLPHVAIHIGLASGEVVEVDGDCYGDAVNVAARLCERADAAEIWASEGVVAGLPMPQGTSFVRLGHLDIRGKAER